MTSKKLNLAGTCAAVAVAAALLTSPAIVRAQECCTAHLACQDGIWCNGIEYCNCYGGCVSGLPPSCHDGDPCTIDSCVNETIDPPGLGYGTGYCMHENICHGCVTHSDCADGDTCTTDTCTEGACINAEIPGCCHSDSDCEDEEVCTDDACVAGVCENTPVTNCCHLHTDCDDSDPCTDDACNSSNRCENVAIPGCCMSDLDCDDGDNCTAEECSSSNICITYWTGTPGVNCCTYDSDCDNGLDCDGHETCDTSSLPQGECLDAADLVCDDGYDCTLDVCDEDAVWCPTPPDYCLCVHTGTAMFDTCSTAGAMTVLGTGHGREWSASGDTHCSADDYVPVCTAGGVDNVHTLDLPSDGTTNYQLYAYHGMIAAADMDPTVCLFPVDECGTSLNWACNATGIGSCWIGGHSAADTNDACFESYAWSSAKTVLPEGGYSVLVDSENVMGGNYDVHVAREPVTNDSCDEAVEIQMGGTWYGTSIGHAMYGCAFCTQYPTSPDVGTTGACSSYTCRETYRMAEFLLNHTPAPWDRPMGYVIQADGVGGFNPALSLFKNRCTSNLRTDLNRVFGIACSNDMDSTTAARIVTGIIPSRYDAELRLHGYHEGDGGNYELTVLYDSDGDGLDDGVDLWPSDMWGANPSPSGDLADGPIPVNSVGYTDTRTNAGYPNDGLNDTGLIVDVGLGAEEVYYKLNVGGLVRIRVGPFARFDAWSSGAIPNGWNVVLWYSDDCSTWDYEDAGGASEGEEVAGVDGNGCIAIDGYDSTNQGYYLVEVRR